MQLFSSFDQFQIPRLRYQVLAEAVLRLFINEAKAGLLIDLTCRRQNVVCPECNLAVAGLLRELYALYLSITPTLHYSTTPNLTESDGPEVEIIHGIIIANIFDHISDKLHVTGQFTIFHVIAKQVA